MTEKEQLIWQIRECKRDVATASNDEEKAKAMKNLKQAISSWCDYEAVTIPDRGATGMTRNPLGLLMRSKLYGHTSETIYPESE